MPAPSEEAVERVRFDYIKGNLFRVIHADGVVGGVTPRLNIHMDVWSERLPIPKQVVHEVKPDGTLGEELKHERTTRDAIVREVEVGVVLDLALAKSIIQWLKEKVDQIEEITRKTQKSGRVDDDLSGIVD